MLVVAVALACLGVVLITNAVVHEPAGGVIMDVDTFAVEDPVPDPTRSAVVQAVPADPPSPAAEPSTPSPSSISMDPSRMEAGRLYIPSLGIYTSLVPVAFSGGSLTIPSQPWQVGIDKGSSPLDSSVGTTLLAGHLDLSGTPGALIDLGKAQAGAMVYVTDAKGKRYDFVTTSLHQFYKTWLPRTIFDVEGPRQLSVVTCGGPVEEVDGVRHYRDNIVLTAVPV